MQPAVVNTPKIDLKLQGFLLSSFNIGNSIAENDPLLEKAQIRTQYFDDLFFQDRVDFVRGVKGAGKTALYRVLYNLQRAALEDDRILMAFGVEPQGDPVFATYASTFDALTEAQFEEFWYGYFVYLALQAISEKAEAIKPSPTDVDFIKQQFGDAAGTIFEENRPLSIGTKVEKWLKHIGHIEPEVTIETKPTGEVIYKPKIKIAAKELKSRPFQFNAEAKERLIRIAERANIKIWILLDRLDEVFHRRSETERRALRALLRAHYRFSEPRLRVKVLLREDIFETLSRGGFTALTHVGDRSSGVMSWTKRGLLHLVTKRLASMEHVAGVYGLNPELIDGNADYQRECFYKVFPAKIGKQPTFEWLISSLRDGKDEVTPRDLIELLNNARNRQLETFKIDKRLQQTLIEEQALRDALVDLSKDKRDRFLFAEFPNLRDDISAFRGGFSDYAEDDLKRKLGDEWKQKAEDLRAIGFLKFDGKKAIWKIPVIWRKGLDIRRGRSH